MYYGDPCDADSTEPCRRCREPYVPRGEGTVQCASRCVAGDDGRCRRRAQEELGYCRRHYNMLVEWLGREFMELPHDVRNLMLEAAPEGKAGAKGLIQILLQNADIPRADFLDQAEDLGITPRDFKPEDREGLAAYLNLTGTVYLMLFFSDDAEIGAYLLDGDHRKPYLERILLDSAEDGDARTVVALLADGRADPPDAALQWASMNGHVDVVRALLADGRADPAADAGRALVWAKQQGHVDVVRLLRKDKRLRERAPAGGRKHRGLTVLQPFPRQR